LIFLTRHKGLNIPSSLYQLPNLEELSIWTDHISDSIRFLKKLKHLSIYIQHPYKNFLSDSIRNLSQLESLLLHRKSSEPRTLPSSIYALTKLNKLDIKHYALSDSIRFLKELKVLTLTGCSRVFPDSIIALTKLTSLDLSDFCMPEGKYPEQIYQFKNLHTLNLGYSGWYSKRRKLLINVRKLKKLNHLSYLSRWTKLSIIFFERSFCPILRQ